MADDTVTLALNGEVTIEDYVQAVEHFQKLIAAIQVEVSEGTPIEWIVHDLQAGSAVATLRGRSDQPAKVTSIVRAYIAVGHQLEENKPIPFRPAVQKAAQGLVNILGTRVTSIRFETADEDATIISPQVPSTRSEVKRFEAYGAVVGRMQTLSNRQGLRFILYDSLHDRAVSCYLEKGREEAIRDLWGNRVIVHGWISRDEVTGRPLVIRHISRIDPLPDKPDRHSYLSARGAVSTQKDDSLPEERIRRIRDAF